MKMKDDRRLINYYSSPLGAVTLESDGDVLTGLKFEERDGPPRPDESPEFPVFAQTKRWLEVYFSGEIPDFTPPLRIDSTPFCKRVCEILLTIPYGGTETYGAIAETIAKERGIPRMAAQAVGGAVHRNPISIIVPCHRVVGAGGALVGYGGGLGRKSALLEIEKKGTYAHRKALVRSYLGKRVHIGIDRPVGYVHKKEKYTLNYPINYGYITGIKGGDGEDLDVYLLGVSEPLDEADCRVIGIVHRKNDVEDKLVAAPDGAVFTKDEIAAAVDFQEKWYNTEIETADGE
ncbi:MAG: methylated-DNA--[Clostridia bacterium]|nr:methylated-DNA--[protein]-cysteine S-methyltransferase [Clostridia bacterium]